LAAGFDGLFSDCYFGKRDCRKGRDFIVWVPPDCFQIVFRILVYCAVSRFLGKDRELLLRISPDFSLSGLFLPIPRFFAFLQIVGIFVREVFWFLFLSFYCSLFFRFIRLVRL
jgi:hypothetical protein